MYCVYLTIYKGNKLPPFYIGYTKTDKVSSGYHGSVSSKSYKKVWQQELKSSPHLFLTTILKVFDCQESAVFYEEYLHKHFKVHKNPLYINQSISNVSFRNNLSTFNHTESTKQKISASNRGKKRDAKTREVLKNAFTQSEKHKQACLKNLKKASLKNLGQKRSKEFGKLLSKRLTGRKFFPETKEKMSWAAKERSKSRLCCIKCKSELPSNSLGSHLRYC